MFLKYSLQTNIWTQKIAKLNDIIQYTFNQL